MPHTLAISSDRWPRLGLLVRTQLPVTVCSALIVAVALSCGLVIDRLPLCAGAGLILLATVASVSMPWERIHVRWQSVMATLNLTGVGYLSAALYPELQASAALASVPAVWLAMVGGRLGLVVAILGSYAIAFAPLVLVGGNEGELASAMAFAVVIPLSAVLGYVIARRYLRASAERDSAIAKRSAALDDVERLSLILRSFADTVNAGILILDVDRKPLLKNQRLSVLGGYSGGASERTDSQIYGKDQSTLLPEDAQPLNRFLDGREIDSELIWVGPPGDQSAILVSGHQLRREDASDMGSALIAQDVTEIVRAAREREDAMATLSHQLRTPLTSIVGYVDMIVDREAAPEVRGPLRVIARNAEHLIALSSSMLNGMRDLTEARIERLDLSDLIESGVDVARGTQDGVARKWIVDVPASLTGLMDRDGFVEVLGNVLGNAVKYSPGGSTIRVSAVVAHSFVEVSVGNDGPSIEPLDMERIFDRFYRGTNVKNSTPGTGIGLAVSRSIMKASGGAITVANTPSGVAFTLRIRASDGVAEQLG